MENLELFHIEQDPLSDIIKEGQDALINDEELRNALLIVLGQTSSIEDKLSLLTDIGLNTSDRCFALCEAIREGL